MHTLGSYLPPLAFLDPIVQDNTLAREFMDALFPQLLFRLDATPEKWEINVGDTQVFTRSSLLAPATEPLTPGTDPAPELPAFEQWKVVARQYGSSIDTHMPSSRTALASIFLRNAKTLGLQAGQTINRVARNKLFAAYTGGDTIADNAGAASTTLRVASLNGFTTVVVNGQEVPISATTPKALTISPNVQAQAVAFTPDNPANPTGPGTLTLAAPATWAAGARVLASDAPTILRVGGVATVDGLTPTSALSLAEIRRAVAIMRRNRVPTHPDGYYHVHLDPIAESQLFADNEFQRLNQGVPDNLRYGEFAVGRLLGCIFISNNESPNVFNSATPGHPLVASRPNGAPNALASPEYHAEVRNASGVAIARTIITGGGSMMEMWIDEVNEYMTEAGVVGKVGAFDITNNGLQIMTDRIRYIIRAPQDRLQQQVSQSWSFSGDWGIPTDLLGGLTGARYKRAIVIESGSED